MFLSREQFLERHNENTRRLECYANKLNIRIKYTKLLPAHLAGIAVYDYSTQKRKIAINKRFISGLRSNILAHEIGHIISYIKGEESTEERAEYYGAKLISGDIN